MFNITTIATEKISIIVHSNVTSISEGSNIKIVIRSKTGRNKRGGGGRTCFGIRSWIFVFSSGHWATLDDSRLTLTKQFPISRRAAIKIALPPSRKKENKKTVPPPPHTHVTERMGHDERLESRPQIVRTLKTPLVRLRGCDPSLHRTQHRRVPTNNIAAL